jgi:glycerol-3-phosphate dehydrogenase
VNGAGVARDAAMRGLRVLLLDKTDVAAGTTGWSTRLIHGGLRYLEHGELGLVRESLRERETLLRVAPHLVKPLPLLIPIYAGARRGPLTVRAGMIAYDLLSFDKSLPSHRMLSPGEALQFTPGLRPKGLRGAALYQDAQVTFAERLAVENALSAREHGATIITHARVERLIIENTVARGVEYLDVLTDERHTARAQIVVNAAGPWVDEVLTGVASGAERLIGGTKGSHLVVAAFPDAPSAAIYAEASADGRPFFIIPWDGKYLIGTTDKLFTGDLDCMEADGDEIEYLLDETNRVLPCAGLKRDSVLYTYTGVRPLPFTRNGDEAGITRRHFINEDTGGARNLISIVGGKLTTYRNLSEQAVDLIFKKLGGAPPPCATARTPLPGAATDDFKSFAASFKSGRALSEQTCARLLDIYGVRAADVAQLASEDVELRHTLCEETGLVAAEIIFAFRRELAETLQDCLLRRTMAGLNAHAGLDVVEQSARLAQTYLGWNEERAAREIADYRAYVKRFHPLAAQANTRD